MDDIWQEAHRLVAERLDASVVAGSTFDIIRISELNFVDHSGYPAMSRVDRSVRLAAFSGSHWQSQVHGYFLLLYMVSCFFLTALTYKISIRRGDNLRHVDTESYR